MPASPRSRRACWVAHVQLAREVLPGGETPPGMHGVTHTRLLGQPGCPRKQGVQKWFAGHGTQCLPARLVVVVAVVVRGSEASRT